MLEMQGRQDDGISFLSKTIDDWTVRDICIFAGFSLLQYRCSVIFTKLTNDRVEEGCAILRHNKIRAILCKRHKVSP